MIVVLGTGGTIAGTATSPNDTMGYTAAQLSIENLLANLPGLDLSGIQCEQLMQVDSKDMGHADWQVLAMAIARHLARPEVTGIVVTHGTDTLEETVYFLHRLLAPTKPVVLVAAMRPASALLSDGPQCLLDGLQLARQCNSPGVVAVVAGSVFHPEGVRKWHAYRLDAFSGGDAGPLAWIENGYVRRFRPWPQGEALGLELINLDPKDWPRVEIVLNHVGADGGAIDLFTQHGVDGMVVAGTGTGTVSRAMEAAMERARNAGVEIRLATRCAAGRVARIESASSDGELTPVQMRVELILELLNRRKPVVARHSTLTGVCHAAP